MMNLSVGKVIKEGFDQIPIITSGNSNDDENNFNKTNIISENKTVRNQTNQINSKNWN